MLPDQHWQAGGITGYQRKILKKEKRNQKLKYKFHHHEFYYNVRIGIGIEINEEGMKKYPLTGIPFFE
jgi:hypothetical protein